MTSYFWLEITSNSLAMRIALPEAIRSNRASTMPSLSVVWIQPHMISFSPILKIPLFLSSRRNWSNLASFTEAGTSAIRSVFWLVRNRTHLPCLVIGRANCKSDWSICTWFEQIGIVQYLCNLTWFYTIYPIQLASPSFSLILWFL